MGLLYLFKLSCILGTCDGSFVEPVDYPSTDNWVFNNMSTVSATRANDPRRTSCSSWDSEVRDTFARFRIIIEAIIYHTLAVV